MDNFDLDSKQSKAALEALLDFVAHVNQMDSIEDSCWHLAQHTIKSLGFEDCVVYLLDKKESVLVQVAAYGPKNPKKRLVSSAIKLHFGQGIVGLAAENCKSILVSDTRSETNYMIDDQPRLSELAVPIHYHNKVLGVIDSEHHTTKFFNQFHRHYLEILAGVLASKITFNSNIQALKKTNSAIRNAKNLSDTLLLISELSYLSKTIEEFYSGLYEIIEKQVEAHSFFVVLYNTEKNDYSCPFLFDRDKGGEFDAKIDHRKMSNTLVAEVIKTQKPKIANFSELEKRRQNGKINSTTQSVHSWLAAPFKIDYKTQGAIALQSYDPEIVFNNEDKEFLTFTAQHISSSIDKKLKEQQLQHQALHDTVTGLTNRSLFLDRLEHAFLRASRTEKPDMAVLFIDFDNFKAINDNFGHQAGDDILKESAVRMQQQLRGSDTLARIGGDEFAILLEDLEDDSTAQHISQRILNTSEIPIRSGTNTIIAPVTIGISLLDKNVTHFEDLLRNADHAMYHAKKKGKSNIQLYEESLHQSMLNERNLLEELRTAIQQKQLTFYFQPIVDLKSSRIVGFEALMRWEHPEKGIVTPDDFIHIAEQHDLMREIDSQLLASVAEQIVRWQLISEQHFYVSINISARRFSDSRLITEIAEIIRIFRLPTNSIVVEVTEHILMQNIAKARNLFYQIKLLGVKISLDDFGTGYSSLSYIHLLPFDIIKIDRSFVSNIDEGKKNHPIVSIIVALAKTLEIELVAEGIETYQQLETLREMGCDYGQGYFLSKPMHSRNTEEAIKQPKLELKESHSSIGENVI
ncbi:MAG: EAL domain-containing protein [Kangiellaceae bacterium]|nr:EAL domain-containing protein [Kangiellaceae bacterium]